MNIITKGDLILVESINDLEYVFAHIPPEIEDRRRKMKPGESAARVVVAMEVDGFYKKALFFDKDSDEGRVSTEALRILLKVEPKDFSLTTVRLTQTFSVRLTLGYEGLLATSPGNVIVDALRKRLAQLKGFGFTTREPVLEDAD